MVRARTKRLRQKFAFATLFNILPMLFDISVDQFARRISSQQLSIEFVFRGLEPNRTCPYSIRTLVTIYIYYKRLYKIIKIIFF